MCHGGHVVGIAGQQGHACAQTGRTRASASRSRSETGVSRLCIGRLDYSRHGEPKKDHVGADRMRTLCRHLRGTDMLGGLGMFRVFGKALPAGRAKCSGLEGLASVFSSFSANVPRDGDRFQSRKRKNRPSCGFKARVGTFRLRRGKAAWGLRGCARSCSVVSVWDDVPSRLLAANSAPSRASHDKSPHTHI